MDLSTSLGLSARVMAGSWSPFVSPSLGLVASAHFDFVANQHFWNGARRTTAEFTAFTGATFGTGDDAGLIGPGTATDHNISIAWADLNIAAPFVMVSVFRPKLLDGTTQMVISIEAASSISTNRTQFATDASNKIVHKTITGAVSQAFQESGPMTVDTNYAIATLVQTGLFRNAVNGATAGPEDLAGTLPTYSLLRLLEAAGNVFPFTGRLRHVLFFAQTGGSEISQANLNTLSGELALI